MADQNNEQVVDTEIGVEELQELLGVSESEDKLPPIMLDLEVYDAEEFQRGIDETSYISGVITALLNTGLSEGAVMDYIMNKETIAYNLEATKLNKEMNENISKNQKAIAEKNEL